MPYIATQSLIDRFGLDELIQITHPTDPTAEAVNITRTDDAIADIDALIDAKLQPRYSLPLASVPRVLSNIACDLVRARLYEDRITDHVADRERAAMKLLDQIADGKVSLGLDDSAQPTPSTGGPQFTTPTQAVFTATSLSDYAP